MKKVKYKWSSSKSSKNLLFFAQSMEELTNDLSWDNFRAYTLDTINRLNDLKEVIDAIEKGNVHEKYLQDVLQEAQWSLGNDPVIDKILTKDEKKLHKDQFVNFEKNYETLKCSVNYTLNTIQTDYKSTAEKLIIQKCFNQGKRREIRSITACYCSFLIRYGYSKEYILHELNKSFFQENQKRISQKKLTDFFAKFNCKNNTYKVYIKINKKHEPFFRSQSLVPLKKKDIPKSCFKINNHFFTSQKNILIYNIITVPSLDPYDASKNAKRLLSIIKSILILEKTKNNFSFDQTMCVHKVGTQQSMTTYLPQNAIKERERKFQINPIKKFEDFFTRLFSETVLNKSSRKKILRSLNTYSLSLNTKDHDTQLISMWTALEALLGNPKKKSKIDYYLDYIVSAISSRYIERLFNATFIELNKIYKVKFINIIKKQKKYKNNLLLKFISIVILEQNKELRGELTDLLKNNPLALYRLSDLRTKFKNSETTISNHELRLKWQLKRIYRIRNSIVHSGESPGYINNIIINLDHYYRETISSIITQINMINYNSNIDQILYNIHMKNTERKKLFNNNYTDEEILNHLFDNK